MTNEEALNWCRQFKVNLLEEAEHRCDKKHLVAMEAIIICMEALKYKIHAENNPQERKTIYVKERYRDEDWGFY